MSPASSNAPVPASRVPGRTGAAGTRLLHRPAGLLAAAAAVLVAAGVLLVLVLDGQAPAAGREGPTPYQRQLQTQVQDGAGAPRAGRDPARQPQTSLAQAAGRPHATPATGRGTRVTTPRRAGPLLGDPGKSGVLSNGCALGYGDADQCLPARAPGNVPMTCAHALTLFPEGVPVRAKDRLRLDTNRDGWACRDGDAGVPAGAHDTHDHG